MQFQKWQKTKKKFKTAKMQYCEKFFLIYLFDFTSFFAWTFLNFLARCVKSANFSKNNQKHYLNILLAIKCSILHIHISHSKAYFFGINAHNSRTIHTAQIDGFGMNTYVLYCHTLN